MFFNSLVFFFRSLSQIKQIIETDKLLANISDEDLKNSGGSKPSMNPLKFFLNKKERLPQRYAPKHLTKKDQKRITFVKKKLDLKKLKKQMHLNRSLNNES